MRSDREQFIGCDAHKHYSVFVGMNERGEYTRPVRVSHDEEEGGRVLDGLPPGSRIGVEASGYCYWLIDEMQSRGHKPVLTHPMEARRRMGRTKKTDRVDAQALAMLLRNGTLPEVWIPPADLRGRREPMRLRMALSRTRTRLKNRIHGVLEDDSTSGLRSAICSVWKGGRNWSYKSSACPHTRAPVWSRRCECWTAWSRK